MTQKRKYDALNTYFEESWHVAVRPATVSSSVTNDFSEEGNPKWINFPALGRESFRPMNSLKT
ncbi:hypothetical protein [Thalassoglobus sp.]|uniref:hypothetical protein n=1 Tax=Thalassoglobus sp. TaxID=2795869 RepID=UPI003AA83DC5